MAIRWRSPPERRVPPLTEDGVVALGQALDEPMRISPHAAAASTAGGAGNPPRRRTRCLARTVSLKITVCWLTMPSARRSERATVPGDRHSRRSERRRGRGR